MNYNIYFDVSALMLIVTVALYFFYSGQIKNQKNTIFALMILMTFLATVFDLITIYVDRIPGTVPEVLDYVFNDIYLSCGAGIATLYYIYVRMISRRGKMMKIRHILRESSCYLAGMFVLYVVNPCTGWIFYFDENGYYTHGPYFDILYLIAFLYLLLALVCTVKHRKVLTAVQKVSIYLYTSVMIGIILYSQFHPYVLALQYGEALSCLVFCFALENPANYKDKWLGIYNTEAFREILDYETFRKKNYQLMGVRIEGLREINEMFGTTASVEIIKKVVELICKSEGNKRVFSLHRGDVVIMDRKTKDQWVVLQKRILDYFRRPIVIHDAQISLGVSMCMLRNPEQLKTADEAVEKISFALDKAVTRTEECVEVADTVELNESRRESFVVQAMKRALAENGFEVYYQPIYSAREKKYTRAEALVRLYAEDLGFISPNEFIPLAEKRGMITEIGALVFRRVCEFMQKERLWERGIERVDVNLSAVQCMHEKLAERLIDMMDAYQIPYKAINFEITETAAVASKENLRKNMEKLLEKGVNFSMDDYGSGYSNTMTIIEYPITVVKLDKSMLWSAMENPKAAQALKYTIYMLKDMGLEIVTEGVETREMASKLTMLGCDLHQGYYYSKPVPAEEFLKIIT